MLAELFIAADVTCTRYLTWFYRDFLPSTGTLVVHDPPASSEHVRVDTGVSSGDVVSVYYDPMIAKLIVHDVDRTTALRRLTNALEQYKVRVFVGELFLVALIT